MFLLLNVVRKVKSLFKITGAFRFKINTECIKHPIKKNIYPSFKIQEFIKYNKYKGEINHMLVNNFINFVYSNVKNSSNFC